MTEFQPDPSMIASNIVARRGVAARLLRNPLGVFPAAIIVVAILASISAPLLTAIDPNVTDIANALAAPGGDHLLGTDSAGRDVWSRLLYGGRLTFIAAFVATAVAITVGVPAGLIAGFYGSWFDSTSSWLSNMLMSLPAFVILLAVRAAVGPNIWLVMTILGVIIAPSFYRLVRTSVRSVRSNLYVDAARVAGLSDARIIGRHVFVAVRAPIIIQTAFVAGIAIVAGAALEFLGLGDPSTPTWGGMLNEGFLNVYVSPRFLLWPALAITVVTASLALLGNAVRDALEDPDKPPKKKVRRGSPASPKTAPDVPTSGTSVLSVRDLTISYPQADGSDHVVVNDVSFDIEPGEILGVVGESGSGKSQTAFAILGLLPDTATVAAGRISLAGTQLLDSGGASLLNSKLADARGRRIAYVPQEPMSNLDPNYTIQYQLTRPLRKIFGLSKKKARERAKSLLTQVGIEDPERVLAAYPHEISGGMAQHILIAGAVAGKPDLLIADEPTTALDVTVQAEVLDLLRELRDRSGMAVLLVTHNFGVVADLCDRVVVMNRSRLVESGDTRQILAHPAEAYTRDLLAAALHGKQPRTRLSATRVGA